jgi:3-hydroxyisobutyrate dehydrogenase-like beta-hydroxyacid dehydrogenase
MLLGGASAAEFLPRARALGFTGAQLYCASLGRASAAKMCRSVMIKGIEALLTESLLAARRYGVEDEVLESLSGLLPIADWRGLARYMIGRSLEHGRRRAAEMREAALTVGEAGVEPLMSRATALRQDWAAGHAAARSNDGLNQLLDALLVHPSPNPGSPHADH